ncbi:hypothetical protein DUI87_35623 [Hirundo rustica rustica]|uniref:Plectin n=1 Tax=Hirundo rustica rustica TaxID=333673 RepID=A0A3M0IFW8_HIRRU|nr:hypothetical protein DUI87_35623 [Hirundo rustica rustica]
MGQGVLLGIPSGAGGAPGHSQWDKKLLEECEQHREQVEECQRYAKQYIDAIKDYELQLVSFKAQVEPVASPAKKPKVQSASDSIIQEYVDLRTQYSELTTLTTQYIKFITETLRRLEDEEKAAEKLKEEERKRLAEVEAQLEKQRQLAEAHAKAKAQAEAEARELQLRMQEEVTRREVVAVDAEQQKQNIQQELMQLRQNSDLQIKSKVKLVEEAEYNRKKVEEEIRLIRLQLESTERQRESAETELQELRARAEEAERQKRQAQEEAERLRRQVKEESQKKREAEEELKRKVQAEREAAREKQKAVADLEQLRLQAEEAERRMRQAEAEKDRQIQVAQEVAQRSAEAELQSKRLSFAEKTAQLELSLQQEHDVVAQLQEEAERLKRQQLEAERSREEAEKELERWRQKANEALRLRLQAEEVAHKKSLAQEEAEKQKEDAEREARKRAKAEEAALRQKELAEEELEKQRELAEGTAQQKLAAEHELIRLKAEMENGEQQRLLLEEELSRLKGEVNEAIQRRKELEEELAKLRAEMEVLLESKAKTEEESRSSSEKSKQRLEAEANKLRELAEEAARLRALSEEAKRQRQLAEDEAGRQRAEAERILKEKLAAINEASRLKAEAEIALKEKEAENERGQHKQDIEEKIALLKRSSESELERQKGLVEDTLRQRRQVEEEIRALKASFERASAGKSELERELNRIRGEAEEVQRSREQAEREAERQRALALEEEGRRREAEEKVQAILAAEEEAGRQRRQALEEVERLRAMVEEARRQKELAEKESERQIQLAREAAQKRIAAEEKAHLAAVQQKEQELLQTRQQEQSLLDRLRDEAERARRAAEEAEFARGKAEQDASLSRQRVEEAERLKQRAEEEAQAKAQAQADAEKLRKEAELEAAKRAQAEQAALRQKQLADAEMEKHKKFAEQTLRQKAQVEQELTKVKLQLDETDHQKGILDEELQRLKEEVTDAVRQKAQVEEELFKVRVQMEELAKLKSRIEEENKALILKDKDNTQKFLAEEAEKMKQVAEEVARLSVEAQEAARMRQLAEDDLAQQRALAEKMLKEKMQAEHAKKLQEDKEQMQQRLAEETEGFQKTLEAERRRQLDITAEAERLKLQVAEMSMAQAKAEEEAKRFKKQAEEISERLHETELATQEKMTMVHTLEIQRHQSDEDAEKLRKAIADLEEEKEKLKREAALLQQKAEEMQVAQQAQLRQETQLLQQSFLTEKDALLQKEKFIEEEKAKLEKLFKDEVNKAQNLKAEQERQQQEMEQEKQQLKAMLDEAKKHQKEAEENVRHKQEELQQLERQRQQQEKLLEEENKKLRERLEQMQEEYKAALAQRREIMIQTDDLPGEAVTTTQLLDIKAVPNGRDAMDGLAQNGEPEFAFDGIRQKVSAEKLADAGILSRESLDKLAKGVVSVGELSQREDVKKYLQGKSSIAGLLIKPSNQKMSIYEAMKKKLLSPGTALVLLEAQAASGFVIDPVRNARLSVNEAVREGVIGPELHNKLLSAERAVTGYKDPYTGDKISLFQAMQKELIVRDHGIRLLEAQIATGGIIDPVHSHRLPVEAAYKRGYFDQEMNQVLSDPTDDTKGFFDPNTQENLTYLQLMERCVTDPDTGLCLLPLTDQAAKAGELVYTDKEAKDVFKKATVTAPLGRFQGKTMTIWELINSEYFTEDQRRDLIQQYRTGKITVEKIIKIVITVVEESERKSQMCFEGLRGPVPAAELLESKIINKDLYNQLHQGKKSVKDVAGMESVRRYLKGTDAIAGVLVESTGQKLTFYEALKRNLLRPEVALSLLEAQAATGYIIDPVGNQLFSVDEAVKAEVVGPEFHEKLLSAEKAVTGYKDPYTGQTVSLYQALQKGLIPSDTGLRLLDVQLATGGIIDPVNSHRLPLEVAYKRGYLDPEVHSALAELAKAFYCPNTQEHLSYAQLQKSCRRDKQTGLCLLPLSDEAIQSQQEEVYTDSQAKECFDKATVEVPVGSMKGRTMTIWELIHSEYFTEDHRRELLRQYKTGKVTIEKIIKIVITIIEEAETKKQEKLTFSGLRAPVPASELLDSCIISKAQYEQLKEGKKSVKDLSETDAVRRFLHGSDCIAGVYVEATKEKLNIYEAMKRNLLRPSTAVVLLEAQAATGFLIDPVKNRKLYVNEAVKAGIVGPELHEKLLSAEKAVTGYKDPYSGDTISLFQAMKKGLIVKEHGIRLLEAQIATGGIIDPVHSHRLPVEVAYKRGYLDEEMNRTLSDPTDDTKGFFDPNTQENLTYVQLKERCIEDPETGLYLLPLREPEKPKVVETTHAYTEAETRKVFEETQVDIPVGSRAGSSMSLWEIMHSDLLPEEQRKHLMEEFQSGRVSKERMIIIIIEIIEKTEIIRQQNLTSYDYLRRRITAEDLYEAKIISQDIYNLLKQGSKTFRELLDVETVWKYLYGSGCVAGIYIPSSKQTLSIYQALKKGLINPEVARSLLEAQAATGFMIDPTKNEMLTVDEAVRKGVVGPEIHDRLLSAERAVTGYRDPYSEQKISLFQAMKKDLIPSEEALKLLDAQIATGGVIDPHLGFHLPLEVAYQRGFINKETYDMLSEPSEVRSYVDPSTDEKLSYTQLLKRCRKDESSRLLLLPLCDTRKLTFRGLRKQITVEELVLSQVMDEATAQRLQEGLTSIEEVSKNLKKFLEGTSCIAGVFVDSTKERLSIYQAMKKGIIRPGTAFELLEAQAATGYVIDPIKGLKLTVEEAVRMGIVGPEFKDKLLSAERAVTGYRDPYTGKLISLFQAMKKGLILKDHGIRLLEAQIATGGIIDPEESHRLPVEVAYKRGLFDEEMNEILLDPSDDTKGFFDPNTEENLTYLQLMERCVTDPETGLCLLPLKEKKRERKTSSKSSVRKRRVVIVDPETGKEMSVYEAYRKGLIDHQTYLELSEQECEWEEITTSSSDGVVKSMIIDRRSGRQYDIDDAIGKGLIDQSALDQYRSGTLSITEFADMLSGNMGGFRSRSSSVGSSSSYTASPALSRTQISMWTDPTEETGPVAGILDTDTLEKVSITEAMRRNLVDNITGQRLLEAQACTGGIIDPNTGDKCTVADAVTKGLVDKIMVDRINLAQKAFYGFEDPRTKTKMSAAQALKKGWLYYEAGQRFLEVQYLTGGLIEPDAPGRVSLDEALQKGTIDARTAQKLRDVNTYSKYLTCPKTKLKISYKDAMDRSMIEDGTGLRLLEASSQSSKGYYSPYNISSAGSTSGSRSGSRTGSRSGSRRGSFDATGSGFSMTFSSSSYTSSSFGRRYAGGTQDTVEAAALALAPAASGSCGARRRSQAQEQLLALRHWLDALEERLLARPEPGTARQYRLCHPRYRLCRPRYRGSAIPGTGSAEQVPVSVWLLVSVPEQVLVWLPVPEQLSVPVPDQVPVSEWLLVPVPVLEQVSVSEWLLVPVLAQLPVSVPDQVPVSEPGFEAGARRPRHGNSVSRPSCLGEKSRRPEELLREPGLDAGQPPAGGAAEAWPGPLEKAPVPVENGWSAAAAALRSRPGSPVLRRSQSEAAVQNGAAPGAPAWGQAGGAAWTPPRAGVPRGTRSWKPVTTREVTEVTEVTETIVTEIVEVTEYPAGEKGGEPVVTRTVTVLTERAGELAADAAEVPSWAGPAAEEAAERGQETLERLLAWVADMEELVSNQKPPSAEAKVAKAQLEEQKALCEEIRGRLGELDGALESGQRVLEMVTGEEAQLTQEKMESLRMRYLIVGQSGADTAHRLGQTLEASSRLGTAPEDLALWLSRMEKELGEQQDGQEPSVTLPVTGRRPQQPPRLTPVPPPQFQQVLESQLARVAALAQRLDDVGRLQLDAEALRSRLSEQKLLSAEILHCRGLAERLLGFSEPLLRCCPEPLRQRLQPSVRELRERTEQLSLRGGACAVRLEHAQSLLSQFSEALEELLPWLEETLALGVQLSPSAVTYEAFKEQQALLQSLREAIAEHRPLVGKLQRVSAQLVELSPEQGAPFQRRWQELEEQYGHIRERVRQAAALLEDALPRYSQLSERMDLLLECLERLQSRLQSQPPLRGDAAHLREQIRENGLALGELEKLGVALEGVRAQGEELLASMQALSSDAAARGIQERAAQLLSQWGSLRGRCQERERWLRELLALAERFWHGLSELAVALGDTQQLVLGLEEAGGEPEAIRARLRTMQALREEVDALQGELDTLGSLGVELMASCGDPDKPDVTKSLDDLYSSWHSLSRAWTERNGRLEEQLQAALSYQDTMQRLLEWLEAAELRLAEEFLVGGDLEVVQQQLAELKHQLEAALLGLGQLQHQLAELLQWLSRTGEQLRGPAPLRPDLQSCEIELAKHKVLRTDVMSHARTVQSVTEAGQGLLLSSLGDSVEGLQRSLQQLAQRWDLVLGQTESRQLELENNLSQVQDITLEITELLQWLEQVELRLFCSKPAWGHPDATKEELNAHLELCRELEARAGPYRELRERLQRLLDSCGAGRPCSTEHSLRLLEHKWDSVQAEAQERKVCAGWGAAATPGLGGGARPARPGSARQRGEPTPASARPRPQERLAEALTVTTEFHGSAQELLRWVAHAEELLGSPEPPSFVLDTVTRPDPGAQGKGGGDGAGPSGTDLGAGALLAEADARGAQLGALEAAAARLKGSAGGRTAPPCRTWCWRPGSAWARCCSGRRSAARRWRRRGNAASRYRARVGGGTGHCLGRYRTRVGRYRTRVGRYRDTGGAVPGHGWGGTGTRVGRYRTREGRYRTRVGRYRTRVGRYPAQVGRYRDTGGLVPDTGGAVPDMGGLVLGHGWIGTDTGGLVPDTGGVVPDTVGRYRDTGGAVPGHGGIDWYRDTGGAVPDTGGAVLGHGWGGTGTRVDWYRTRVGRYRTRVGRYRDTGGAVPDMGGLVPDTGGAVPGHAWGGTGTRVGWYRDTGGFVPDTGGAVPGHGWGGTGHGWGGTGTRVDWYQTRVGRYRTRVGWYRTRVGRYRTRVGRYQDRARAVPGHEWIGTGTQVGRYRTRVGGTGTRVGRYRTRVGRYRDPGGAVPTWLGRYRTRWGVPDTGGVVPDTGGAVPDTGGVVPDTGGVVPDTGGAVLGHGWGGYRDTGGLVPGHGGIGTGTRVGRYRTRVDWYRDTGGCGTGTRVGRYRDTGGAVPRHEWGGTGTWGIGTGTRVGAVPGHGGIGTGDTGGAVPDTGGVVPDMGDWYRTRVGRYRDTGGAVPDTGGAVPGHGWIGTGPRVGRYRDTGWIGTGHGWGRYRTWLAAVTGHGGIGTRTRVDCYRARVGRYRDHGWGGTGHGLRRYRTRLGAVPGHGRIGTGTRVGRYRTRVGRVPDTGGLVPDTGGAVPDTGGAVPDTGDWYRTRVDWYRALGGRYRTRVGRYRTRVGRYRDTGGLVPDTGWAVPGHGWMVLDTGGAVPDTAGAVPGHGGIGTRTRVDWYRARWGGTGTRVGRYRRRVDWYRGTRVGRYRDTGGAGTGDGGAVPGFARVDWYRDTAGAYRRRVGRYRTRVDWYRTRVGGTGTRVGWYRTWVRRYRTRLGRYRDMGGLFCESRRLLLDWMDEVEPSLEAPQDAATGQEEIKCQLAEHKAFQKVLRAKRAVYEATLRSGRALREGARLPRDLQPLEELLGELKERWDALCGQAAESFTDALRALTDWLYRAEPQLSEDAPVGGDRDLVGDLMDKHKAEEFHSLVRSFLGRLSESEKSLKYGACPEEEAAVRECQGQLQELLQCLQCQQLELECIASLGEEILASCHPDSVITVRSWVTVAKSRFQEVQGWAQQQGERLRAQAAALAAEREEAQRLLEWMAAAEEALALRDQEPLPEEAEALEELSAQHAVFMEELNRKQPDVEKVTKSCKRKLDLDPRPAAAWPLLEEFAHFDFGVWRKRYMQWISQMKSRVLDVFRGIDRDQDGRISQREFIESVLASKFPTNVLEMNAVATIFDLNGDGFIDYYEFVSALHPNRDPLRRCADADQIQDEVNRQVAQCNCAKRFQVEQISANRYRFGESQQLRMVRILRSTLMVRVGGGWIALDEFLVKNDPCRVKGRTNLKINEKYLSSDVFGAAARCAGSQSAASSKVLSPSRSNSSLSLYSSASAPSSPWPGRSCTMTRDCRMRLPPLRRHWSRRKSTNCPPISKEE